MARHPDLRKVDYNGVTIDMLVEWCLKSPFPGNTKWTPEHPIWDAYLPGYLSPREAWSDPKCIEDAVDNMYWIIEKGEREGKYADFNEKHYKEFRTCVVEDGRIVASSIRLLQLVLIRFTVSKIAPKVTALRGTDMKKIIDTSGVDISNGVYLPMAGFGGIKDAAEIWYREHRIPKKSGTWDYLIECYDINPEFCKWYGWSQRDMLAQVVETDKVCLVCPPFGNQYEAWKETPSEMSDIEFIEWYRLIHEYVKAPAYIVVGPEVNHPKYVSNKGLDSQGNKRNGLFSKTVGIMWWNDEMYEFYKDDPIARKQAGIKDNK